MKRVKANPVPLIIEDHPLEYDGYPFITLVQYRKDYILTIIDNATDKLVRAFVLDLCVSSDVSEEHIIKIATDWYKDSSEDYPISVEFSKREMTEQTSKIYRTYATEYITRIIGPFPKFPMNTITSIRRRRKKKIPMGVVVHDNFHKNKNL